MTRRIPLLLALSISTLLFAACGGGSAPGDDDDHVPIDAPADVFDAPPTVDGGLVDGSPMDGADIPTCPPCDDPPTPCHALTGTCVNGACEYDFIENASCDDGNPCTVADTCTAGGCSGTPRVCNTPPGNVCLSETVLRSYDQNGSCNGGLCVYNYQDVTCPDGACQSGACQTDPCANVTCDTPPNGCFTAPGVCQNGSCHYPYNNGAGCDDGNACTTGDSCQSGVCKGVPMACNTPPPNVCENESTLRVYSSVGSCNLGSCSYSFGFVSCANGCVNGQCASTGWTIMASGVTVWLKTVWAASPASVWAGGNSGTLVYYNGAAWQVRSSGTTAEINQIHGTAANDVFALAGYKTILHYDGNSWSTVATSPNYSERAIFAIGPREALVFGYSQYSNPTLMLSRIKEVNGTWEYTTVKAGGFRGGNYSFRIWAESPDSVYLPGANHWDGANVTPLGQATYSGRGPGRMWKEGALLLGLDWQNGTTVMYEYDAVDDEWVPMPTGFAGTITDYHGPSDNRVFLVGNQSSEGHVLYFDGLGWTDLQLPPDVPRLEAVWALPSGEVFAVGEAGTILKGP